MLYFNEHKLKIAVTPKGLLVFNNWLRWVQFHFRAKITYKTRWDSAGFVFPVRLIGLEPTQPELPDPKSGASTNFATGAWLLLAKMGCASG